MISTFDTVYAAFNASVIRWADRPFLHIPLVAASAYSAVPIDLTYAEAASLVSELSNKYPDHGLKVGHRVAMMLDNRADFILHYLAFNSLGVSVVPLNGEASVGEVAHVLRDSGSVFLLALSCHKDLIHAVADLMDRPLPVAWLGDSDSNWSVSGEELTASPDEAALLYTSGSTGAPKGCMLSNAYMLAMGRWYLGIGDLCAIEDGMERLLTPLPLVHMNALATSTMVMLLSGGCIVQLDRFHPRTWWDTVRESQATIVHYLGVMPAILLQAPRSNEDKDHVVKFGLGSGAHPNHHSMFEKRFGFPLVEGWAMTEVGGAAAVIDSKEPRHVGERCFGRPGRYMEYRIVDEESQDVVDGLSGEFWVRAAGTDPRAGFFSGYANQANLTESAWEHGYFHTGDVVRLGFDGALHFVDRKKSIIRRSGENIAALEVEGVINELPGIQGVGVGPVEDELRGEEVMACIQLAPGVLANESTARAIFHAAGEHLIYYKLPGYIAFVPELPLTASQKLQRGTLKSLSQALVDCSEVFDLRSSKKRTRKR